ncbi:hypothetical protein hmeg3_03230 [Herbaspirillum sp. meg3]|nr:hypothetical protein hmeg3_03230 [Herbaspirillum sp. meg3]
MPSAPESVFVLRRTTPT